MDFTAFKMSIIEATGLAKDALHIYVGIGAYFLCLMLLRPIFKKQGIRSFIALVIVTCIALLGEYLDNRETIESLSLMGLSRDQITASIRDLINTCMLSYVLYGLNKWTKIFHASNPSTKLLKQR